MSDLRTAPSGPSSALAHEAPAAAPSTEFIVLVALLTALIALAIDTMLPALGQIATDLGAGDGNQRQWVLTTLFGGLALGQLLFGPLSDQIGRKPAILLGLAVFAAGSAMCALATDFTTMLAGRLIQGFGVAGPRVVSMAMVRDGQSGPAMARVMSLVMSVFIAVPIVAPSIGQLLLMVAGWRAIFGLLLGATLVAALWLALRQPETLPRPARVPMRAATLAAAARAVMAHPVSGRYTLQLGLLSGCIVAYLGMAQQIFGEQYGAGALFGVYFALLASGVGLSSALNARWVMRLGIRRLARRALGGLVALAAAACAACALTGGHPPLPVFLAWMWGSLCCLGFLFGNGNALAMEPMAHQAGLAASVIGTVSTLVSMLAGGLIGHFYDGTLWPLALGFLAIGLGSGWLMAGAERRRDAPLPAAAQHD